MKTLARNEAERNQRKEDVKSLVGRSNVDILEEMVCKYITKSTARQKREEETLKLFVESTISSLKAHDIGIKNLELKIEQCAISIKKCLRKDTKENVNRAQQLEGTTVLSNEEEAKEPKTFSEKFKRRLEKKHSLINEHESLTMNIPLVKSIKNEPKNLKCLHLLTEEKNSVDEVKLVMLNERCSAILCNDFPPKRKTPEALLCHV